MGQVWMNVVILPIMFDTCQFTVQNYFLKVMCSPAGISSCWGLSHVAR